MRVKNQGVVEAEEVKEMAEEEVVSNTSLMITTQMKPATSSQVEVEVLKEVAVVAKKAEEDRVAAFRKLCVFLIL